MEDQAASHKGKGILRILIPVIICLQFSGQLRADSRVEIYNLRSFTHPAYTRIVVDIGKLREYSYKELFSPDRIYVDIYQTKLNPILHGKTTLVKNGYIQSIRIAQKNPTTVRVVADLDFAQISRFHVWHLFDPFRVIIDIYAKKNNVAGAAETSTESLREPPQPTRDGYSMIRQLGLGIQKIVIDPGHGGTDPGCIGKKGLQEKDVVLDVCLRLKKILSSIQDIDVIFTRESDIFVPPENRTVIANQKQADLFISIHANANPNKNFSGVQTFFLNFSQDPNVNRIAARENATSTKNISEMKSIIDKIVKNSKIMESRELAESIQNKLVHNLAKKYTKVRDLGVRGGPFWVLIGGEMPSILVEISHLSNAMEESRLRSPAYRQEVAHGIYEGILEYIRSLGKG
jgi:N-acetylmuramoyl-L-alanine amidase